VKNTNAECGHTCKPRKARPETRIYGVAYMDVGQGREQERKLCASCKGPGHSLRSTPSSCTLQVSQRHASIVQRYPGDACRLRWRLYRFRCSRLFPPL